jgi:hypothetical protein
MKIRLNQSLVLIFFSLNLSILGYGIYLIVSIFQPPPPPLCRRRWLSIVAIHLIQKRLYRLVTRPTIEKNKKGQKALLIVGFLVGVLLHVKRSEGAQLIQTYGGSVANSPGAGPAQEAPGLPQKKLGI